MPIWRRCPRRTGPFQCLFRSRLFAALVGFLSIVRDLAERITRSFAHFKPALYRLQFIIVAVVLTFPLTVYARTGVGIPKLSFAHKPNAEIDRAIQDDQAEAEIGGAWSGVLSLIGSREWLTATSWNFGLRATRSREPRQARKGATVPGKPSVPRRFRSSSNSAVLRNQFSVLSGKNLFFA